MTHDVPDGALCVCRRKDHEAFHGLLDHGWPVVVILTLLAGAALGLILGDQANAAWVVGPTSPLACSAPAPIVQGTPIAARPAFEAASRMSQNPGALSLPGRSLRWTAPTPTSPTTLRPARTPCRWSAAARATRFTPPATRIGSVSSRARGRSTPSPRRTCYPSSIRWAA